MRYLPFLSGSYTTAPGLTLTRKAARQEDRLLFQMDGTYAHYYANKQACRTENIHKYYIEHDLKDNTIAEVNKYILDRLVLEHPSRFLLKHNSDSFTLHNTLTGERISWKADWREVEGRPYLSLFDALSSQVQEDTAVFQLTEQGNDFLAAIHLCSPNHWSPAEKSGKSFDRVHEPVPNMERVTARYQKMLSAIVNTPETYTRFAWVLARTSDSTTIPKRQRK